MDRARALDINDRLCWAYFVIEGITPDKPMPDLSDVSLADAIKASAIIEADPVVYRGVGKKTISCHLDERAVARTLAAAIKYHEKGYRVP
jgi:hypothetical protein